MKITLAQIAPKLNRSNVDKVKKILKEADSDLVVFPELSLNGYMLQDKLSEDAFSLNELEDIFSDIKKDFIVGAAIKEKKVFRNSAIYFSNSKILSRHDKVHLPNYGMFEEARYFSAGSEFESFFKDDLKISMLVCEDLWNASMIYNLHKEDPDLVVVISASPARGFSDNGLEIEDKWQSLLKSTALMIKAKVVFVNRVGFEDGLGFWGGSSIIDENAKVLFQLPKYDEVIKTFDIEV